MTGMVDCQMTINKQKGYLLVGLTHFCSETQLCFIPEFILRRKSVSGRAAALKYKALCTEYHRNGTCQKLQEEEEITFSQGKYGETLCKKDSGLSP